MSARSMTPAEVANEIEAMYRASGGERYGEQVSLFEHSLLTAQTAERSGATDVLVVAAFLHDIGHLLSDGDDSFGNHSHDQIGGDWLAARFPDAVSEPVRLHVDAKRYLCAIDPGYHACLSPASQYTLVKQGGQMSDHEVADFASLAFARDAVQLRRWEDNFGKQPTHQTLPFHHFRPLIEAQVICQE